MRAFALDDLSPTQVQTLGTIRRCVINTGRNWVPRGEIHWGAAQALAARRLATINHFRSVVRLTAKGEPLAEQARVWVEDGLWPGEDY